MGKRGRADGAGGGSSLAAVAGLVALLTLVVFAPVVQNGFVDLDDEDNLVNNPAFRGFAPARLWWMLTTTHLGPWQPLSWLSFAVDHALWGLEPTGYHLTNLLLHAAN